MKTEASEKETYRPPALSRPKMPERSEHFSSLSMPPQAITPRGSELPRHSMRLPRNRSWV